MKKIILFLVASAFAGQTMAFDDPRKSFDSKANVHSSVNITWVYTDDVQKDCEAESRQRGNKGFGYPVNACTFWTENNCLIITRRFTNMHTLGHEVRHCFQGNWH